MESAQNPYQNLIDQSKEYFRIHQRKGGLLVPFFTPNGVRVINEYYQKKYPSSEINIASVVDGYGKGCEELSRLIAEMRDDSFLGLTIFSANLDNILWHAEPCLCYKKDGDVTIFKFRDCQHSVFSQYPAKENVLWAQIENYGSMQQDGQSCSIFATNTLKNILLDDTFLQLLREGVKNRQPETDLRVQLKNTKMSQESSSFETKREAAFRYVRRPIGAVKDMNLKSFKKGHKLVEVILKYLLRERQIQARLEGGQNLEEAEKAVDKKNFDTMAREAHFSMLNEESIYRIEELERAKVHWKAEEKAKVEAALASQSGVAPRQVEALDSLNKDLQKN